MASRQEQGSSHWAQLAELGSAWGLNFLYGSYRVLGRWPFRILLAPVLLYYWATKPLPRRASLDYLRRVARRGALRSAGALSVLKHYFAFAESVLDKVIAWHGGYQLRDLEVEGRESVAKLFAEGRGVLFIGSHLGNLELCRVLSHERDDLTLRVLVHTRHAENFNRLLGRLNPKAHVRLHQLAELDVAQAAWLSERLSLGESLLLAGDRTPPGAGRRVAADFLGAKADFAQGPWILAAALACPVFLVFCLFVKGRYRLIVEPFAEQIILPRKGREAAIQSLAQRFAERLEARCLEAPWQWFNFYPYWQAHES